MSALFWLSVSVSVSLSGAARAAPCGRPDVDLSFPPEGAASVPPNALLSAHYAAPARYDGEGVSLTGSSGEEVPLVVSYDEPEATLRAVPERALSPGSHQLSWPGLRGVSGAGLGRGREVSFVVQGDPDTAGPAFDGLTTIDWDLARDHDPCVDGLQDRFVFELGLAAAADDRAASLLQVLVFQTRDPASPLDDTPLKVATRAFPDSLRLAVRRPASKSGETCFAAVVQDLLGNVSGGGEREVCVTTREPPFFEGCAQAVGRGGARAATSAGGALSALLVLAFALRRRVARAPRAERSLAG